MFATLPPSPPAIIWCQEADQVIKRSPVLSRFEKEFLLGRLKNSCPMPKK
jgi:hypothetical protein